jgi:hypothetical protein
MTAAASQKHYIMTSRFNNDTWRENSNYRKMHPKFGCIYCSPCPVSSQIAEDGVLFVLEMNNDENRIMGIGTVKNKPTIHALAIYNNNNYNRYQYYGKWRISRDDMTDEEETIMRVFDILCFSGNTHQKRGQGLKRFPLYMLSRCSKILDLEEFIVSMFRVRMRRVQN